MNASRAWILLLASALAPRCASAAVVRMAVRAPTVEAYLPTVRSPELRQFMAELPGFERLAEFSPFSHSLPADLQPRQDEAGRDFLARNVLFFEELERLGAAPLSIDPREAAADRDAYQELYADEVGNFQKRVRKHYAHAVELAQGRARKLLGESLTAARRELLAHETRGGGGARVPGREELTERAMEVEMILKFHGDYIPEVAQDSAREVIERLHEAAIAIPARAAPSPLALAARMREVVSRLGLSAAGGTVSVPDPDHEPGTPRSRHEEPPRDPPVQEPSGPPGEGWLDLPGFAEQFHVPGVDGEIPAPPPPRPAEPETRDYLDYLDHGPGLGPRRGFQPGAGGLGAGGLFPSGGLPAQGSSPPAGRQAAPEAGESAVLGAGADSPAPPPRRGEGFWRRTPTGSATAAALFGFLTSVTWHLGEVLPWIAGTLGTLFALLALLRLLVRGLADYDGDPAEL